MEEKKRSQLERLAIPFFLPDLETFIMLAILARGSSVHGGNVYAVDPQGHVIAIGCNDRKLRLIIPLAEWPPKRRPYPSSPSMPSRARARRFQPQWRHRNGICGTSAPMRRCHSRKAPLRSEVNIELNFPPKLRVARSRLYRRRFLQVNTRWKALAEIYTMHSFAPFFNLKISAKNR